MENKRVLLVRLSALGDVIFNLPLAAVLKRNGYEVTWITSEKGYDIVNSNPLVDETILAPVEKWKKQKFFQNFSEYLKIVKYIRSKHFDIAIDTQLLIKSFIWMVFSGAKRRIVSKSAREFSILGGNEVIGEISETFDRHVIYNYLKFAEYMNLNIDEIEVKLPPISKENKANVDNLLKDADISKPIIAVAPATTWAPKHWNKDNWKKLICELEQNYTLIFTGTAKDKGLIDYISGGRHLSVAGKTSLLELSEVFRRSDLVLSLDSGSTHLAWATSKPNIVSIFCCTPTSKYAPIGSSDKYIALSGHLSCQPCHKHRCPLIRNQNKCTFAPSVEEVLDAVHKLLPVGNKS